jgi:kynurenine formamidase
MRTVLDLTHTITPAMPVYPGTAPPTLHQANTVEQNGFAETRIGLHSHTGTHVDAPAHMLAGAATLAQLEAGHFVGRACAIAVSGSAAIDTATLQAHAGLIEGCEFVLVHTGWSRYWGQARYFDGYPVLSADGAGWLTRRGLKGIGVDTISVDPVSATVFGNHLELFRAGMVIVENLTGLGALVGQAFLFSCLPLKLDAQDGSPVRAVAILE